MKLPLNGEFIGLLIRDILKDKQKILLLNIIRFYTAILIMFGIRTIILTSLLAYCIFDDICETYTM